jgi:hypothetical protein
MSVLNLRLGLQFVVDAAGSGWVCRIAVEDEKKTFSAFFKARTLAPTTNYLTEQCFSTRVPPILYWDFNVFVDEVLRLQKRLKSPVIPNKNFPGIFYSRFKFCRKRL